MDVDEDPVIEYDELKRLRDQIKNLKLENDKLRQRTLPTLSSDNRQPTQRTTAQPVDGVLLKDRVDDDDDILADLLEIDELSLTDEETWLSPSCGGPSGAELALWLRRDADAPAWSRTDDFSRPRTDDFPEPRRGVDCRTFTRRKTPARPALRCSATARGLDSTFRVLSEPHLNLTKELRLLETSSSQDELNGTYHISANHMEDDFHSTNQMDEEFHLSNQREELYESTSSQRSEFHVSTQRRELQTTFSRRQEYHSPTNQRSASSEREAFQTSSNEREAFRTSPNEREAFRTSPNERAVFRAPANERPAFRESSASVPGSPNRRAASCDSLDDRPMDDVRSMARLQQQSLHLAVSTPKPHRFSKPAAVDDGLPSPIASETSSSASSRTGSAGNIATEPRALPSNSAAAPLPKMKPLSAAAAASRPAARASGLPRPLSRIPAPRARKPAWADGCY